VAGTTHLLSLASARSNSKQESESLARVDECSDLLKLIAASWPAAEQAGMLLDGLREDYGFSSASAGLGKGKRGLAVFPGGLRFFAVGPFEQWYSVRAIRHALS
jgi:hypothetical protein